MAYLRTQILLDPEEHRRLVREAAERGLSLSAYIREIIAARTGEAPVPYEARSWDGLFDLFAAGPPRGLEEDFDAEVREAFGEAYERSIKRPARSKRVPRKRS
jgi:hypothetical protein